MGERQNEAARLCRGLVLSVQQLLVTLTEWGCFLFRKGSQCVDVYTHHCGGGGGTGQSMYCTPGLQRRENGMKTV